MSSVRFVGLFPHAGKRPDSKATQFAAKQPDIGPPRLVPMPYFEGNGVSKAQSLSLLTFAGSAPRFQVSPAVKLEGRFIETLGRSKDADHRAGAAELLGVARSMNAVPALVKLLDPKEDVQVRIAAVKALGLIAESTHENSHTRAHLGNLLVKFYQGRKEAAIQQFTQPKAFSFGDKLKEEENREWRMKELSTLIDAISVLGVPRGQKALHADYRQMLVASESSAQTAEEMRRAIQLAEEGLHESLQKQYKRPLTEILANLNPKELAELRKNTKVRMADDSEMDLLTARSRMGMVRGQQQFAFDFLMRLMDGLSLVDDEEVNASLKLSLNSSQPLVKAKGLEVLSGRKGVSYMADVYPNLASSSQEVRSAALEALLGSSDQAAKQKTVELLSPDAFFKIAGGGRDKASMQAFVGFLKRVAADGDEYVNTLTRMAANFDYDTQTRQIALMTLGFMTEPENARKLQPLTIRQAKSVIRAIATDPPARTPMERENMALLGTQLWLRMKEPKAVEYAIRMADSPIMRMNPQAQEALLGSVLEILAEDAETQSGKTSEYRLQRQIFEMLKRESSPLYDAKLEEEIEADLEPDIKAAVAKALDATADKPQRPLQASRSMTAAMENQMADLRPILVKMLDNDKSLVSQMIASRILGFFRDRNSVEALIEKVRDPLKGKMDWSAQRSYNGTPSIDGANIRLNAMKALGDIGDARALAVMLDALEDPVLKDHVVDPLAKLAPEANDKADDAQLKTTREKLSRMLADGNISRAARANRMKVASALFQFKGGVDAIKEFTAKTPNPDFKRHVLSALVANNYALDPSHPDHGMVKALIQPELGVERLHAKGITGKGVEMAIVDGGYVDETNDEGFQDRVRLPAKARDPEHYHPTMVMSTAAANGKIKGVAPDALVYSDKWPELDDPDNPMDVYKKIIAGKLRGENDIRVINNSWGLSNSNVIVFEDVRKILREFKKVVDLAEKAGIQMVFAAGNEGEQAGIPRLGTLSLFGMDVDKLTAEDKADLDYILDKVILVGATNTGGTEDKTQHRLAEFSSIGDSLNNKLKPTVVAPGVDMMVYGWKKNAGNPKELVNGTSFASPFVTGVISLMVQANPDITPRQIREILKKTAVKLPNLSEGKQGFGEVDPEAAVTMAKHAPKRVKKNKSSQKQPTEKPSAPSPEAAAKPPEPPAPQTPPSDKPETPPADSDKPAT